jgi:hypothetical protein
MAISKNMDFPNSKKSAYSQLAQQSSTDQLASFIPVPGPKGDTGNAGPAGPKGDKGDSGERGERGPSGKDGKTYLPVSGQDSGWARYSNNDESQILLGATRGIDGWVNAFIMPGNGTNEKYLPSLYNESSKKLNFKGINLGSKVSVTYTFEIETLSNNTELWCRTYFKNTEESITSYVGVLKYQYLYEMSVNQTFYLDNETNRLNGAVPQLRADMDSIVRFKSIEISVS